MKKLRIGFILPAETVPAWAAQLLEKTRAISEVELVTGLLLPQKQTASRISRFYFNLDRRAFHPKPSAWESRPLPADLPLLRGGFEAHIAQLQALRLDVLINLSLTEIPATLIALARLGVWTVRDGRSRLVIGAPLGWRELAEDNRLTTCEVEVLRDGQPAQIVAQALLATDPLSTSRNQLHLLWRTSVLLPRTLFALTHRGEDNFFATARPASPAKRATTPNIFHLALLGPKQAYLKVSKKISKRFGFDQWMLMAEKRPSSVPLRWDKFQPITPPRDRFWADPFVVERDGQTYIFIEEYPFATKRGIISCLTLDSEGNVTSNTPVLERPYHLSYPFVFEHKGQWYMIPETGENRAVEIYRCVQFPNQWTFEKTLLHDAHALDATLFEHEGRWWMFVNLAEDQGNSTWDSMHLFYADDPLSDNWTAHPLNPVVADVRSARPAGRLFLRNGQIFRPSQDSMERYGHSLRINRVDKLSTTDYAETCVDALVPPRDRNIIATHTLNVSDNWMIIDIQTRRSNFKDDVKI